jgi:hypothetical protein
VLSNIDHTRFGNSATNRFSFSNSRFGSHTSRFERPEFGGRHEFRGGESNFGFERESSFGGDAFSFFPDLLGLALAFGSFGARGFGLPGLGFPGFGLLGLGLNLLESGFGGNGGYGDYGGGSGGDGGYGGYAFERSYGGPAAYGACVGSIWTPAPISPFRGPALIPYPAQILACPQ